MEDDRNDFIVVADVNSKYHNVAAYITEGLVKKDRFTAIFNLNKKYRKRLEMLRDNLYIDEEEEVTIEHIEKKCRELKEKKDLKAIAIDLENKRLDINGKELSKRLYELFKELKNATISVYVRIADIYDIDSNKKLEIDDIEDKEITEFATNILLAYHNEEEKMCVDEIRK